MKSSYDVIVIGAGVSGLTSASFLKKKGFSVLVIEKTKKPGQHTQTKIDITESTGLDKIIKDLDLKFLDKSNQSHWFSKNRDFVFRSKVSDFFVKRGTEKDSIESQLFVDSAVDFLPSAQPVSFDWDKGKIKSVSINSNKLVKRVNCSFVVGADGSNSQAVKLAGLISNRKKEALISGFGFVGKGIVFPESETQIFFDSELAPGGYFFSAKTKSGLDISSIVVNSKLGRADENSFRKFIDSNYIIKKALSKAKPSSFFSGSCASFPMQRRVKGNFLACGDAAGTLDPIFGYGVRQALISGFAASEAILSCINQSQPLEKYDSALCSSLELNNSSFKGRAFFDSLSNKDLDELFVLTSFANSKGHLDNVFDGNIPISAIVSLLLQNPFLLSKIGLKYLFS